MRRITIYPGVGSPHRHGTRKVVLDRYPYSIIYVEEDHQSVIFAVAHHKQRPGYWRKRLRSPR